MVERKNHKGLYLSFLLFLLFSILGHTYTESIEAKTGELLGRENSKSGTLTLRFISENLVLYRPSVVENKTQGNRFWRQILFLAAYFLFLEAVVKAMPRKYYFHSYHCQKLFHTLIVAFFLGGRAPPFFAYR